MENIEQTIADTLLQRPFCLAVGEGKAKEYIYIYPMTLGRSYLSAGILRNLNINKALMSFEPNAELIRLFKTQKDLCLRLLAINTLNGKAALDNKVVEQRMRLFDDIEVKTAVALLSYILGDSHIDEMLSYLGIDKELKDMRQAEEAKKSGSTMTFCGKSIWGSVIDNLASKYGWTLDYILWDISYVNIQMLLADSVKIVYLTDEEREAAGVYDRTKTLDGNDPHAWERLKQTDWYKRAIDKGDIAENK